MNKSTNTYSIGFGSLLTLIFITLKLTGYIDWNWWWVLSPLWGGLALVIALYLISIMGFLLIFGFLEFKDYLKERKK